MACGPLTLSEAQGSWGGGPVGEYGKQLKQLDQKQILPFPK